MQNRAGKSVQNFSGESAYYSFLPSQLPPDPPINTDSEMWELLLRAHKAIALLNGLSDRIPNVNLFISMYVRKEALVSSQIEGTQCTLDDMLNPAIDANVNADVSDVVNYVRAISFAIRRLDELPLCNRLIRETHAVLMNSVRGCDKTPGEFRASQNWIGGYGSTLKNARYIPPNPQDMVDCMTGLEKYINDESDATDPLIKAALIHYQFETIHPFLDGNGRVGRLLITLFLIQNRVLSSPVLYLSCFLKSNRIEYYDRMSEVRKAGDYEQWIRFFLRGIAETAEDAIETIDKLTALRQSNEASLQSAPARARERLTALLRYLESCPIIETAKTAEDLHCAYNTAAKDIAFMCNIGILCPAGKDGKSQIYSYAAYLDILRKDT